MRLTSTTFSIGLSLSHDCRVVEGVRNVTFEQVASIATEIGAKVATVQAVARALDIAVALRTEPELPA